MAFFEAHSWLRFSGGLIIGLWVGAAIGCAVTMLLAGRRLRQLETANLLLRVKLRTREKSQRRAGGAAGPVLVVPPGANRPASSPLRRASGL